MHLFKSIKNKYLSITNIIIIVTTFFVFSYLYIMLNGVIVKFAIMLLVVPIFFFNQKFYQYLIMEFKQYKKPSSIAMNFVAILILSLMINKSINHIIIINSESLLKIPATVGLIILGFQNVFLLTYLLEKIDIKNTNYKSKKYDIFLFMIPSVCIMRL